MDVFIYMLPATASFSLIAISLSHLFFMKCVLKKLLLMSDRKKICVLLQYMGMRKSARRFKTVILQ